MRKIATGLYQVSSVEGFSFEVTGPQDPIVSLDGRTLSASEGQPFEVTPEMMNGLGSSHFLFFDLIFSEGDDHGGYLIVVSDDAGAEVDRIPKDGPDEGNSAQVQTKIIVAADNAMLGMARKVRAAGKRP